MSGSKIYECRLNDEYTKRTGLASLYGERPLWCHGGFIDQDNEFAFVVELPNCGIDTVYFEELTFGKRTRQKRPRMSKVFLDTYSYLCGTTVRDFIKVEFQQFVCSETERYPKVEVVTFDNQTILVDLIDFEFETGPWFWHEHYPGHYGNTKEEPNHA